MYRILCQRPSRELGAGLTWLKQDGKIIEFSTMEEAGAKAKELSENIAVTKVKYTARAHNLQGDD
ncbi:MAG: hypothetical protein HW373_1128 [Deltaproteobacteria bacterium]|jgi:hypothetical protein|nr:hypothetical protein [Deltaproteobacteria bacterium]